MLCCQKSIAGALFDLILFVKDKLEMPATSRVTAPAISSRWKSVSPRNLTIPQNNTADCEVLVGIKFENISVDVSNCKFIKNKKLPIPGIEPGPSG